MGFLKKKVALITGAGRGIGKDIALEYASQGASLVLISRTKGEIQEVSDKCAEDFGVKSIPITSDISKEKDVLDVFNMLKDKFGTLDILVNNAAIHLAKEVTSITTEEWDNIMAVNLRGTFLCCREALRIMKAKNYGKIINISSESGIKGFAMESAYNASKFGQIGLTKSLANEVRKYNININAVLPSATNTKLFMDAYPCVDGKRIIQPLDIAKVAAFLASEDSKAIKAANIEVFNAQDFEPVI